MKLSKNSMAVKVIATVLIVAIASTFVISIIALIAAGI